jgi:hypothetical protein
MAIIYAVAIGISIAATALVARRIGEHDPERAAQAAGQVILLGVLVSAALGLVLGSFAPRILLAMGGTPELAQYGGNFARIMLGGNATVFLIFLINAAFRGAGDAVIAMRTLWLANAINIALGPCFIFGWGPFPELGVTGAAVATNIGRGIGVLYQVWHLLGHHSRIRLRLLHLVPDREVIVSVSRMASSGVAQLMINTTSWIGLVKILGMFGSAALAGYTIAIRLVIFALLPAWGLANAGATLVGQNLGAQKPDRAEAAVWIATRYNTAALGLIGPSLHRPGQADRLDLQHRSGGARARSTRLVDYWPGVSAVCGGDVHHRCLQWRGRHVDADAAEPVLFLAAGDSARLASRARIPSRPDRSLHRRPARLLRAGGLERSALPEGPLEDEDGLAPYPGESSPPPARHQPGR